MHTPLKLLAAALLLATGLSANAQYAGTWIGRLGATQISPQVKSGDMTAPSFAGTKTDVGANSQLSGGLTYMYTNHIAFDLPFALPFKHKLYGAGALSGAGQIGETKALPFTLFAQYRLNEPTAALRPYAGLGLTYAYFYDETGNGTLTALTNPGGPATRLGIESKFALTPQIGFSYALNNKWLLDASFSKSLLKTRTSLSTGQTIDTTLNPNILSLSLGMKF
jgi:outer membrane protein